MYYIVLRYIILYYMTKTTVDYNTNSSVIYRIKCKDGSCMYTYTGATTNFTQRKATHKSTCNNANSRQYNLLLYQTIRANGGWSEWEMVIVELFPCKSKRHLSVREQYHIEQQENNMNHNRTFMTDEEKFNRRKLYYEANRDEINAQNKAYREAHREELYAKMIKYREANKEEISEWNKNYYKKNIDAYKARGKAYREANKEEISEWKQNYYKNNIDTYTTRNNAYRQNNKEQITAKQQATRLAKKESQPQ